MRRQKSELANFKIGQLRFPNLRRTKKKYIYIYRKINSCTSVTSSIPTYVCILGVRREKKIFEETMAENLPNLMKDSNPHIPEAQGT